jgi:hypothetical protein
MAAYDVFGSAAETNALKVVLEGAKHQQLVAVGGQVTSGTRRDDGRD